MDFIAAHNNAMILYQVQSFGLEGITSGSLMVI
jgi:hypothetical protein